MKKIYLACLLLVSAGASAQQVYCIPAVIPYSSAMPGITHFVLNTIDRVSDDLESPSSGFVSTGMSTGLTLGSTYSVSITHTVDATICADMNIRIWIDYNQDGQLDDAGETVISYNHHLPGTYTGSFTVPLTAMTGDTRMRLTVKMSDLGGHTLPTPCDNPADPFGYHGEMEDYTVNLTTAAGIEENGMLQSMEIFPNPSVNPSVRFSLLHSSIVSFEIFNLAGEKIHSMCSTIPESSGEHLYILPELESGYYIVRLLAGNASIEKPVLIGGSK